MQGEGDHCTFYGQTNVEQGRCVQWVGCVGQTGAVVSCEMCLADLTAASACPFDCDQYREDVV